MSRPNDPTIYGEGLRLDVALYFAHILGPSGRQILRAHCLTQAATTPEARDLLNFLNDVERGKNQLARERRS